MAPISSTEQDTDLMIPIISQLGVGKIDMKRLQRDLKLKGDSTASVRLTRFKKKLAKASEQGDGTASVGNTPQSSPSKRKAAKGDDEETPRKSRKAKVAYKEEEDEVDLLEMAGYDEE